MADSSLSNHSRFANKLTRCRTGCLRCRKRRRKCDEKKPRCQNCIDKNFVCHYGLQVTFLPKNSITVTAGELRPPKEDSSNNSATNYNKIQFVNEIDNPTASADEPQSPTGSISPTVLSDHSVGSQVADQNINNTKAVAIGNNTELDKNGVVPESNNNIYHGHPSIISPWPLDDHAHPEQERSVSTAPFKSPITQPGFCDKDEFAVRGLLALGTRTDLDHIPTISSNAASLGGFGLGVESPLATTSTPGKAIESGNPEAQHDLLNILSRTPTAGAHPSATMTSNAVTETQRVKLIQHYRYHVAPWLDICDLKHAFGIIALQMAVRSEPLLSALIALSAACMQQKDDNSRTIDLSHLKIPVEYPTYFSTLDLDLNFTEAMILRTFGELRFLVSDVSGAWTSMATKDSTALESLVPHAYGLGIDSAIYWMNLRMDLGVALANNIPIRTPLPAIPTPSLSLLCSTEDTHERVGHYAQVLLWLCAKALIIYHQETDPRQAHQLTDSWLQIFEELNQWHSLRPQEFQPMVELNVGDQVLNPGSQFPMLLFTNGAGAFCNQLYHTGVLLLLECKPRTALLNHPQSPVMSPLWHAQRVCGIALNNDRQECWDPCLLASFLVAARHMTHELQQQEIVQGFGRIRNISGWEIGQYLTQLREDWSFFDGVE